jgi:hypothetical protein
MFKTHLLSLVLLVATDGFAQSNADNQQKLNSLDVLVGKRVIAQRIPLCTPGTFNTVLNYAG